jgi:hypothetical protein
VTDNVPLTPDEQRRLSELLAEIRAIAYLPSRSMTCEEQMSRIRDLFHDYDHPEDADHD